MEYLFEHWLHLASNILRVKLQCNVIHVHPLPKPTFESKTRAITALQIILEFESCFFFEERTNSTQLVRLARLFHSVLVHQAQGITDVDSRVGSIRPFREDDRSIANGHRKHHSVAARTTINETSVIEACVAVNA